MSDDLSPRAQALLDAQVAFVLARLEAGSLQRAVEQDLDLFLLGSRQFRLDDLVTADSVKETARRYATEMNLGGAMPELVGDIARSLYRHKVHEKTTLADLVPDSVFQEVLDKFLEMDQLYAALVHESISNPLYANLVSDLLQAGIREFVANLRISSERVPGAKSALRLSKAISRRTRPDVGAEMEEALREFIQKRTRARLKESEKILLGAKESQRFREAALDLWDEHKHMRISRIRDLVSSRDVEEYFVIGYEYWQYLRKTRFFRKLLDDGIDTFYRKYGDVSPPQILEEVGVSREMMVADAMRFAPPVIAALKECGVLASIVRAGLVGFYASDEVQSILES